ncbi:flippase [Candidatus Omnitrophota bacterium]
MLLKRLFNKETIGQSAGIVLFFAMLQRVIQTGRGIVFARLLGPGEYGAYTLAYFFIPLAVTIARLGIPSCFNRYIPQYEQKGALRNFLKKTYLLVISGGAFISLVCFFNSGTLSQIIYGSSQYQRVIAICALTIFPYVIFEALIYSFSGMRVFKVASALRVGQLSIFTVLGIIFVVFHPKAESTILADLISFILVVTFFSLIFRKHLSSLSTQNLKIREHDFYGKIFKFSIFFVISPIINTVFNYTDRWMLGRLTDLPSVGIYSIAINITGIIFLFGMIAGNVLLPSMSNIWEQGDRKKVMHMLNFALKMNTIFLLFGALILFLLKSQLVSILYGTDYVQCLPVVGILLIFWLHHGIYWTVAGYAEIMEKTYIPLICCSVGLISNVFLNYILIPQYGIMGAAVASTFSFSLIVVMMHLWFRKLGLKIESKTILVCIFPLIFVFSTLVVVIFFIVLLGVILGTNFIVTRDEKEICIRKFKEAASKFKKKKQQ